MCARIDSICQKEFEARLQARHRIHHQVVFDNQKSAFIDVKCIEERCCPNTMETCGILSFSETSPLWCSTPEIIDNQKGPSIPYYYLSNTLTGIGHVSGLVEMNAGKATMRFVKSSKFSPKLYPKGWGGGSRARIRTYKVTTLAKGLGKKVFYIGVLIDGVGLLNGSVSPIKAATNIGIAAFATFGGPVGLTVGLVYWGLDLLGVFDEGTIMPKSTNRPDIYIAPIDNLRVVSPRYSILNQLNTP